jgi:hypothetical protein
VFPIDLNIGDVVLEDGWDVDLSVEGPLAHILPLAWVFGSDGSEQPLHKFVRLNSTQEQLRLARSLMAEGVFPYLWESAFGENARD